MLVVIAIISILVAIAFPIYNNKLEESRKATNVANIRTSISVATNEYLSNNKSEKGKYLNNVQNYRLYNAKKDLLTVQRKHQIDLKKRLFGSICVLVDSDDE